MRDPEVIQSRIEGVIDGRDAIVDIHLEAAFIEENAHVVSVRGADEGADGTHVDVPSLDGHGDSRLARGGSPQFQTEGAGAGELGFDLRGVGGQVWRDKRGFQASGREK